LDYRLVSFFKNNIIREKTTGCQGKGRRNDFRENIFDIDIRKKLKGRSGD